MAYTYIASRQTSVSSATDLQAGNSSDCMFDVYVVKSRQNRKLNMDVGNSITELEKTPTNILSGLLEYLDFKPGVKDVHVCRGKPASVSQIHLWEQKNGCILPADLKVFFLTNNGLTLTWSFQYNGLVHPLGRINVNKLNGLLPLGRQSQPILFSLVGSVTSTYQPSIDSLDNPPMTDSPTPPIFGSCYKIFPLDYHSTSGHVCLVYETIKGETKDTCVSVEIWLLDLSLSWHFIAPTFSDYFRLAVVHLGLIQWPYILTQLGLTPQGERWFRMFIPKRLEMDLAAGVSSFSWNHAKSPGSVVDISRILVLKPSKEKRSKTDAKAPNIARKLSNK